MKIIEENNKFASTIQSYREALSCLQAASQCLRSGKKHPRKEAHCSNSYSNGNGELFDGYFHPTSSFAIKEPDSDAAMDLPSDSSLSTLDSVTEYNMNVDSPSRSAGYPSSNSNSSGNYAYPSVNYNVYPGDVIDNNAIGDGVIGTNSTRRPAQRGCYDEDCCTNGVDYTDIEVLVARCSDAITAILADLQTNNVVVKRSLQSLVQSLRLHRSLLEQRSHSPATSAAGAAVGAAGAAVSAAGPATSAARDNGCSAVQASVEAMRTSCTGGAGLADVVGLTEVKEVLQDAFFLPSQFPHLFQGGALQSWSRLLLYGPPGTGKTCIARALAADLRCPLYTVTPSLLLSAWLGDTEKIIRELFRRVRQEDGPVIVFLDEMDALCRTRTQTEDDVTRRIKTELLVHLDDDPRRRRQPAPSSRVADGNSYGSQGPIGATSYSSVGGNNHNSVGGNNDNSVGGSNYNSVGATPYGDDAGEFYLDDDGAMQQYPDAAAPQCPDTNKVFVIAATNCPWDVDPAFLRRFQKRCYVPLPHSTERQSLLHASLTGCSVALSPQDWATVAGATEGHTGADLQCLATAAAFRPVRELHTSNFWRFTDANQIMPCSSDTLGAMQYTLDKLPADRVTVRPVLLDDLMAAAKTTPRSVPVSLLRQYRQFADD